MITKRPLILAIDDDPVIMKVICDALAASGFRVISAANGIDGLWLLAKRNPDLVLLDIMMPDIDGYVTLGMIRQCSDVPVVMITCVNSDESMAKTMAESTADGYIVKPFSSRVLVAQIWSILKRHGLQPPNHYRKNLSEEGITNE